jgi:hypothetical protein
MGSREMVQGEEARKGGGGDEYGDGWERGYGGGGRSNQRVGRGLAEFNRRRRGEVTQERRGWGELPLRYDDEGEG